MAGSGSSWTGSWPPCTQVGVQRVAQTALVQITHSWLKHFMISAFLSSSGWLTWLFVFALITYTPCWFFFSLSPLFLLPLLFPLFFSCASYLFSTLSLNPSSLPAESRSEFLEKLQRARSQVKPVTASQPILSSVGPTKLTVGNWSLTCLKEGEIAIHNSDGQQATILKEDLPGFVFESNRGTKHSFTAETSLGESW